CLQTPCLVLHVNTERITTSSIPAETVCFAWSSVIISPLDTIVSFEVGSTMSSNAVLPTKRSNNGSMTSEPTDNSATVNPLSVPQSASLTITSCATSTNLLVK